MTTDAGMDRMTWTCDHCGRETDDYADIGYDGPQNRDTTACSPFMVWVVLCVPCAILSGDLAPLKVVGAA